MLYDNLGAWDGVGRGRKVPQGGVVCVLMTDSLDGWQKPTQYCKAIILQLKIKELLLRSFLQEINVCFHSLIIHSSNQNLLIPYTLWVNVFNAKDSVFK